MIKFFTDTETRDYYQKGDVLTIASATGLHPFQLLAEAGADDVFLIAKDGSETPLPLTLQFYSTIGGKVKVITEYSGDDSLGLGVGVYGLRINCDGVNYYSEWLNIADCEMDEKELYRDRLHLPLQLFSEVQPRRAFFEMPINTLQPFQVATENGAIYLCDGNSEMELTGLDLQVETLDGNPYIILNEPATIAMPEGVYYLRIGELYSNWFRVGDCATTSIRFGNGCDIGGIFFQQGYEGDISFDSEIGQVDVEYFEDGYENDLRQFTPVIQKTENRWAMSFLDMDETTVNFFRRLQFFDLVEITHAGETFRVERLDIEAEPFDMDYIVRITFNRGETLLKSKCCVVYANPFEVMG